MASTQLHISTEQQRSVYSHKHVQIEKNVCMYLMIGKGQIAQKDHIGAKIDLRAKLGVNISILLSFES